MAARLFNAVGRVGIGIALAGGVINTALFNVDGGHRAVIFDRFAGVRDNIVGEGTHFLIPWVQKPIIFDIRSRPRSVPTITGSKDLQNVNITLRVLFRPIPARLPGIYTNLGTDYDERVLPSIINEVLKAVVAQYDAAELIMQREVVSQKINEELVTRAAQFGLLLDDISITHLAFGREFSKAVESKQVEQQGAEKARYDVEKTHLTFGVDFTRAVEAKQVAQQEAEKARFTVEKEEQRKRAAVIRAEGDSKGAELLAKALGDSGEGLVELRKIEAAEDIAYQMSQSPNVVYLPTGQQTLLSLPH